MFTLPELYNGKKKKIVCDNGFDQAVTRTVSKEPGDMIITGFKRPTLHRYCKAL